MRKHLPDLLVLCLSLALPALAQDQGIIVGTVRDASGAVVPNAQITVSNPEKGFVRHLVTNSAGEYTAARIPIGGYVIDAQAPGFQKLVRTGITLEVGQTLRVDLRLQLGSVTQTVSVSGSAPKVQTESGTVSDVVTGTQIVNLNLNGRNYQALFALTPGSSPDNSWDAAHLGHGSQAVVSFNGTRFTSFNVEMDGADNNDEASGGQSPLVFPNIDDIAEFRISTSNYGADIGKRSGAIVEIATKSGTKQFHGDAYEFLRNDALDANDWFLNRQIAPPGGNAPKQPLKWNIFGYTLGGPVYVPGHYNTDKSKTFFFWSESWARYRQGTVLSVNTPSVLMRHGDLSQCDPSSPNFNPVAASGCKVPINPATGLAFPGDIVPINPNAQILLNTFFPLPNNGVIGYVKAPSLPTNYRQESLRVDQNINDKTRLFVRYTQDAYAQEQIPAWLTGSTYDTITSAYAVPTKNIVANLTHNFTPSLMNEFMVSYGEDPHRNTAEPGPASITGSIDKPSSWTVKPIFAANSKIPFLPGVTVCGGTPFCGTGDAGVGAIYRSRIPVFNVKDDVVQTVGRHTLKFGIFWMNQITTGQEISGNPQGYLGFYGGGSLTTGNALADMDLGRIQSYSELAASENGVVIGGWGEAHLQKRSFEPYFEDDWNVSRKLTLNVGARYYYFSPYHDRANPELGGNFFPNEFDPAKAPQLDASGNLIPGSGQLYTSYGNGLVQCNVGGVPPGCRDPYRDTIAPRFGFAYDPWGTGKTAIRGGYGIYYDIGIGGDADSSVGVGNPPTTLLVQSSNINGYQNLVPGPLPPGSIDGYPLSGPWSAVQQFNLTVEHEFPRNNLLSVGYVGSLGRHLSRARNLDQVPDGVSTVSAPALAGTTGCDASGNCNVQEILIHNLEPSTFFVPYRGFSSIFWDEEAGSSHYHSLQVNFRHPVGHGLTFQTTYTWAHAMDNASSPYAGSGGEPVSVDDSNESRWMATSDFNRTQVLVMNYIYDIPLFQKSASKTLRSTLGGWRLSGITSFMTGEPINPTCGVSGYSSGIGEGVVCDTLGSLKIQKGTIDDPQFGPTPSWFSPGVLVQPTLAQYSANREAGMFGYLGRNVLTGPGRNNWDLALLKDFSLPGRGERYSLQFRLETYNTFNHPQWNAVNAFCSGTTPFGAPCNGADNIGNGEVSGDWAPRLIQLGMKFIF